MNADLLGQLDTQVKYIKSAETGKDANELMLETINILIEGIDKSKETLDDYDEDEMRGLFITFGTVAKSACDFYESSKDYLDPAARSNALGQLLETTKQEITEKNALMKKIEEDSTQLLEDESELNKISFEYETLRDKTLKLQEIKKNITPDLMVELRKENHELKEVIAASRMQQEELEKLKVLRESILDTIVQLDGEKTKIEESVVQTIDARIDELRVLCANQSKDIENYKSIIEKHKAEFMESVEEFERLQTLFNSFDLHFGENSRILNALRKHEISSLGDIPEELAKIERSVRVELSRCDALIKDMVVEQEAIKKTLIDRSLPQG